jgi:hypothetical protein|tara:strand:+ start:213 stop:431 length:219 start_codon:yes stop_codon:yes gene_type:complete
MIWQLIFLIGFVFVLTYDPSSGGLDHLVGKKPEKPLQNAECKEGHYQEIQFAKMGYPCSEEKKTHMGAIIGT